ncbi:hypothetical protein GB931_15800 [Modestobacter sp. I12A-02628]|uniref:Uncharacterized protein n=1 Tax=Goekera deserti TaxID=2497753 RepID=A0A7K3WID6_9ACTN|nr:hypothetical protein [Goekera deserti]MPQ99354.1 hypothetical protein [Goekera deserti]NDI50353.1 hypothetical protein [Goekera deserti]NEL55689.1 hypothetical protein [Goekera deserti]
MAENQYDDTGALRPAFVDNYASATRSWAEDLAQLQQMEQDMLADGYPPDHPLLVELRAMAAAWATSLDNGRANRSETFYADYLARKVATDQLIVDIDPSCDWAHTQS